jgi:hypothetical protein
MLYVSDRLKYNNTQVKDGGHQQISKLERQLNGFQKECQNNVAFIPATKTY